MIESDLQSLSPGALIELFELDTTAIGDPTVYRFHAGVNGLENNVVFGGRAYTRFPVEASGFDLSGQGTIPRPKLAVANVTGLIGALARSLDDFIGAKLTRLRTFAKYLDAVNFPDGINPTADPNQIIDREIWYVDRKSAENKIFVEFELAAAFDVSGVFLPRRQVIQNVCAWKYRGPDCGYTGTTYFDRNDQPAATLALDQCGKRLSSCKLRFGPFSPLPFGAFPAVGLIR